MQLVMKDGQYGLMISPSRIYWVDDAEALRAFVGMYNRSQGYSVQHSDQQTPLVTGLSHDQARVVADALTDASGLPYGVVHPVQGDFSGLPLKFPSLVIGYFTDNSHNARIRMAAQLEDLARKLRSGYEVVSGGMYANEDSLTSDIKLTGAFITEELTVEAQAKQMIYASGDHNVLVWAEHLIRQLPETHKGRNSWMVNHAREPWVGTGKKPDPLCEDEGCPSHGTDHVCLPGVISKAKATRIGEISLGMKLNAQDGTIGQQVMQLVENNPLNVDELGDIALHCLTPTGIRQLRKKLNKIS